MIYFIWISSHHTWCAKGQTVNILGFFGPCGFYCNRITQLCSAKAAIACNVNEEWMGAAMFIIKLCLQHQAAGRLWATGHSLSIPDLCDFSARMCNGILIYSGPMEAEWHKALMGERMFAVFQERKAVGEWSHAGAPRVILAPDDKDSMLW